jgi:basic amino acid/polyamine antiporter, APA family
VFQAVAGVSPSTISLIAIMATLNTILAQITMAARVVYGMARQGDLPAGLGRVHSGTHTPLIATWLTVALSLLLALLVPMERLAEGTSVATLVVFAAVNLSLLALRRQGTEPATRYFRVPIWVPWVGLSTSLAMICASLLPL